METANLGFDFNVLVYVFFSLSLVVTLAIALVITFFYENRRIKVYQDKLNFHKRHNLIRGEIVEKLLPMTLDEYIEYRKYHHSELATFAFTVFANPLNSDIDEFGLKMEYYWDCKKDLTQYQSDILKLWDEFFKLLNTKLQSYDHYRSDLLFLAKLTRLSNIDDDVRDNLDTKLLNYIDDNYPDGPKYSFHEKFEYRLNWAKFRVHDGFIDIMALGVSIREVEKLKHLWNNFESEFMKLKSENPSLAKSYYFIIRSYFERFSEKMNSRFRLLFKEVSVWAMEIFKNEDRNEEYSEIVTTYRRIVRKNKRGLKLFWDYLLDYTTGYGEKPHLLLYYFLASILFFTIIYYPYPFSPFEFKSINKEDGWFTSLINVLYFNFTTMISNLYGNISPENELAKIFVITQQLLGFTLSGSFIALFLRKVFRD